MLDYIKQQINAELPAVTTEQKEEEFDVDSFLEYAQTFQELDDLSEDGTLPEELNQEDSPVNIPLEDDVEVPTEDPMDDSSEIDSVELNIGDGRVMNLPMDASIMESTNYEGMRTYEDFVQSAMKTTKRFIADDDDSFMLRVQEAADAMYQEYSNSIVQESVFTAKIDLSEPAIPYEVTIDFGECGGSRGDTHYYQTIPVRWQTAGNKGKQITKKQLETIQVFIGMNLFEVMAKKGAELLADKFNFGKKCFFDVVKPVALYIPMDPMDKYVAGVGFKPLSGAGDEVTLVSRCDVKQTSAMFKKNEINPMELSEDGQIEVSNFDDGGQFVTKSEIELEAAYLEAMRKRRDQLLYQEAIEISGDAGATTDAPPSDETAPAATDTATDTATDAPAEDAEPDKVEVDTNDVSDQIADNLSNDQPAPEDTTDGTTPLENTEPGTDATTDIPEELPAEDGDLDQQIADLDANNDTSEPSDADTNITDNEDIGNMTFDELMAQAVEKLKKNMTINQIRDFVSGNTPAMESATIDTEDSHFFNESNRVVVNASAIGVADNASTSTDGDTTVKESAEADVNDSELVTEDRKVTFMSNEELEARGVSRITPVREKLEEVRKKIRALERELETLSDRRRIREIMSELDDLYQEDHDLATELNKLRRQVFKESATHVEYASPEDEIDALIQEAMNDPHGEDEFKSSEMITEAFIITKRNVNGAVDTVIRNALGLLNDSQMSFKQIQHKFGKFGKNMSRVLSKAISMKDVYNESEIDQLVKLNQTTLTVMRTIGEVRTPVQLTTLLEPFTAQCKSVAAMVNAKKA